MEAFNIGTLAAIISLTVIFTAYFLIKRKDQKNEARKLANERLKQENEKRRLENERRQQKIKLAFAVTAVAAACFNWPVVAFAAARVAKQAA